MTTQENQAFTPALIIVDVQEDFCPPNGSLAVPNGRSIIPTINKLLALPFALKIATKDWHPRDHVSFAANHHSSDGAVEPYTSTTTIVNPHNASESYETRLWPVHCVQGTPGAELLPELDSGSVDVVLEKGTDARVEMYSAFYTPLRNPRVGDSGLAVRLRSLGVTDCYVVGLAADYCVMSTALDAAEEGFRTWIVDEGTKAVSDEGWSECRKGLGAKGVVVVGVDGPEVGKVRALEGKQ